MVSSDKTMIARRIAYSGVPNGGRGKLLQVCFTAVFPLVTALSALLPSVPVLAQQKCALLIASGALQDPTLKQFELSAPVNDVHLMANLLVWRFGFSPSNIHIVGVKKKAFGAGFKYDSDTATLSAIHQGYRTLAACRPDYAVIYYSGHGTLDFQGRRRPDEENGYAEALVPYDAAPGQNLLYDKTLYAWATAIKAKRVTAIFDACFSGGLAKGGIPTDAGLEAKRKFLPTESTFQWSRVGRKKQRLSAQSSYVVLAACQNDQMTVEVPIPPPNPKDTAQWVSPFTQMLCQVLSWNVQPVSYGALLKNVEARLMQRAHSQTPFQDGGNANWTAIAPFSCAGIPLSGGKNRALTVPVGFLQGFQKGLQLSSEASNSSVSILDDGWFTVPVRAVSPLPVKFARLPKGIMSKNADLDATVRTITRFQQMYDLANVDANVLQVSATFALPDGRQPAEDRRPLPPKTSVQLIVRLNSPGYLFAVNADDKGAKQMVCWSGEIPDLDSPDRLMEQAYCDRTGTFTLGLGRFAIHTGDRNGWEKWKLFLFHDRLSAQRFASAWTHSIDRRTGQILAGSANEPLLLPFELSLPYGSLHTAAVGYGVEAQ